MIHLVEVVNEKTKRRCRFTGRMWYSKHYICSTNQFYSAKADFCTENDLLATLQTGGSGFASFVGNMFA